MFVKINSNKVNN